jgi:DNA-binding CsgD family transcriptional regulator
MSNSEEKVLKLVGMTYEAALDECKWGSFLEAFASAVGGSSAILRSNDMLAKTATFSASIGYDTDWQAAYCKHFVKMDYFNHVMSQYTSGRIFSSDHHIDQAELRKSEYYNDYLRPQDKVHAFGAFLLREGGRTVVLATQRGKRAGEFRVEELRLMSILVPHVTRAVQVHRKFSNITLEKEWALGALDQLSMSVILTNSSGAPSFVNRAAEQMLIEGDGINTHQGKLILASPSETVRLYKLIDDAAKGVPGTTMGGDMRIALRDGKFLHCVVMPIPLEFTARWNIGLASGCVAVFLSKPGALQLPPQRLAEQYGLTPAEGRLAAKLTALRSVEQASDELCISVHTARSQLKSIFTKTGVQSQSELLMLLATGTLAHCRDGKSE